MRVAEFPAFLQKCTDEEKHHLLVYLIRQLGLDHGESEPIVIRDGDQMLGLFSFADNRYHNGPKFDSELSEENQLRLATLDDVCSLDEMMASLNSVPYEAIQR